LAKFLLFLLTGFHFASSNQPPQIVDTNSSRPCINLLVHNYASVPLPLMKIAREITIEVLQKANVDLRWVDQTEPYNTEREGGKAEPQARVYLMFIVKTARGPLQQKPRKLGFASTEGVLKQAFIFYDRVSNNGNEVQRLLGHHLVHGFILGHAIVHELSHLVLGPGHSKSGLMRDAWDLSDMWEMIHGGLHLTGAQANEFRSKLARNNDVWCNTQNFSHESTAITPD